MRSGPNRIDQWSLRGLLPLRVYRKVRCPPAASRLRFASLAPPRPGPFTLKDSSPGLPLPGRGRRKPRVAHSAAMRFPLRKQAQNLKKNRTHLQRRLSSVPSAAFDGKQVYVSAAVRSTFQPTEHEHQRKKRKLSDGTLYPASRSLSFYRSGARFVRPKCSTSNRRNIHRVNVPQKHPAADGVARDCRCKGFASPAVKAPRPLTSAISCKEWRL